MMRDFLLNNRDELLSRCKARAAQRPERAATDVQLENGIPMFLDQLTRTLLAESRHEAGASLRISGGSGGDAYALSEIGVSAAAHGKALLALGYSLDQVVHDYGDLCQTISELAFERDAPFTIPEFGTLNRCLDNAIADSVTEFSAQRDADVAHRHVSDSTKKLGFLAHELRNSLQVAGLAAHAMEVGGLTMVGATGSVLKKSLASMEELIDTALAEVRARGKPTNSAIFSVASLVHEAKASADLGSVVRNQILTVTDVNSDLCVEANRERILAALANLLSNAFKFSHPHSEIQLSTDLVGDRVCLSVEDSCGGLRPDHEEKIFKPFIQFGDDRSGIGLGLSIARQNVETDGGTLTVRNKPGSGCVFTIALPNCTVE